MSDDTFLRSVAVNWDKEPRPSFAPVRDEAPSAAPQSLVPLSVVPLGPANDTYPPGIADSQPGAHPPTATPAKPYSFLEPPRLPEELGRIGSYRVLRLVGEGGMGLVFEAEDTGLQRRVALKVLRPEIAGAALCKRFLREARVAASLPGEHIAQVYQVGEQNGLPFLAMEYLSGESLEARLKGAGRLAVTDALTIIRQAAEGLRAAHARGLIHRDIKPANLWLEGDGSGAAIPRVKVLDFGLARPVQADDGLTAHGDIVGTPRYMAPEQVRGDPLDARTDVYALGCTLYQLLTGETPFGGKNSTAMLLAIVTEEAPSVRRLAPHVPEAVAALVRAMLSKDAHERPADAADVVERIRALERGVPPEPSTSRRTDFQSVQSQTDGLKIRPTIQSTAPARRKTTPWAAAMAALVVLTGGFTAWALRARQPTGETARPAPAAVPAIASEPLKIGILHSLTGTFAVSERPMVDALMLAVEEINRSGGVLGRPLQPVLEDGRPSCPVFAERADKLIARDGVTALFGCWGSSNRKRVVAVCAKHNHLLLYAAPYEGLEQSPYVFYLGGAPNQQLLPAVEWAVRNLDRRRFFLVGSDYVYSRAANAILKDELATLARLGAQVVGEEYVPLDGTDFAEVVGKVRASKADMVLNTIDGNANVAFFQALREGKRTAGKVPILWFSFGEDEMAVLDPAELEGDYVAAHYFQSIEGPENTAFVARFRARFPTRRVSDAMLAAYASVYLWKQATEAAGTASPPAVRKALGGQSIATPGGRLTLDPQTQHAWHTARVGRVHKLFEVQVEFTSPRPLRPEPFPASRPRAAWESFLGKLYEGWGGSWEAPRK